MFRNSLLLFFFNDTATTEIYTLSLHDALPISRCWSRCSRTRPIRFRPGRRESPPQPHRSAGDRKSTRLNSSHQIISYAVFCLKKKMQLRAAFLTRSVLDAKVGWLGHEQHLRAF